MILLRHVRSHVGKAAKFGLRDEHGAQLVEFAVALPLLVLFVVGIFDFSNAFTFKQKLTNIARDAARVAASDPASDLATQPIPTSVIDSFQVVDNYLLANNLSDCGVVATPTKTPGTLIWTYTGTTNCPTPGLTIIINRGYYFPPATATATVGVNCQPPGPSPTLIIGTCVSIQYFYSWRFGNIASVLGASTVLPTTITSTAVAMNEN